MSVFTPYISIKSVLYDISTISDEKQWNEANLLEWAFIALRKNKSHRTYVNKLQLVKVIDHKTIIPADCKYIFQIAYRSCADSIINDEVKSLLGLPDEVFNSTPLTGSQVLSYYGSNKDVWKPLRLTESTFAAALHCSDIVRCPDCEHSYSVNEDMIMTTSFREGYVLISYLTYPTNDEGDALIPDDQDLREAIMHYCLYRFYMGKVIMDMGDNQAAERQRTYHLAMFQTLNQKATGALNMPTLDQLENIKNHQQGLLPRSYHYDGFFTKFGNKSKETY